VWSVVGYNVFLSIQRVPCEFIHAVSLTLLVTLRFTGVVWLTVVCEALGLNSGFPL